MYFDDYRVVKNAPYLLMGLSVAGFGKKARR